MATLRTRLRRIFRINRDDPNASYRRLVFDKRSQLVETPTAHLRPLILPEPSPCADGGQIFHTDSASGVCSFLNEVFADHAVYVLAKTGLFARSLPEFAANGFRAMALRFSLRRRLLQCLSLLVAFLAHSLDPRAAEPVAVRINGDILNTEINADEISCWSRGRVRQVNGHEQKPLAVLAPDQIALTALPVESFRLVLAHDERNNDPAFKGQQRHAVNALETHQSLIVGNACIFPEMRPFAAITTEGFGDLSDTSDGHLRRQSKFVTQALIKKLLKFDLVGCLKLKGFTGQPMGGGVKSLHRGGELAGLIPIRQELCLQGQFHDANCKIRDVFYPLISDIRGQSPYARRRDKPFNSHTVSNSSPPKPAAMGGEEFEGKR